MFYLADPAVLALLMENCMISGLVRGLVRSMVSNVIGVSSGSATFSPLDLSPALWLDASDAATITQVANAVSQWNDKSGNARHATQGTGANQPVTNTRTLNARNVIDFDGSNDNMLMNAGLYSFTNTNNTTFIVYMNDVVGGVTRKLIEGTNGSQTLLLAENPDSNRLETRQHTSTNMFVAHADDTAGVILSYTKNGGGTSARRNGPSLTTGSNVAGGQNFTITSFNIGSAAGGGSAFWDGVIAEVILYGTALSASDLNLVGNYLATKWGITWVNF